MISFVNGPAAEKSLMLKRAPIFLRVAIVGDDVDALDQLDDKPKPTETLYVYRRLTEKPSPFHIRAAKFSGWFLSADYALFEIQPDAETLRDSDRWREWCSQQWETLNNGK